MSSRFLTLGFLVALAGSGAGLRAQGWSVTAGSWSFADVTALTVNNLTLTGNTLPASLGGSFSRPWRGDEVLETFAVNRALVDLSFSSRFFAGTSFTLPGASLTQWELTAEDGLFATESVVFNDIQGNGGTPF